MTDRFNELILDSLPHWAMLIEGKTHTILAANRRAKQSGAKVGGRCWDDFARNQNLSQGSEHPINNEAGKKPDSRPNCYFCRADHAIDRGSAVREEVTIQGRIYDTHWVPVQGAIFLHYAIDVTEQKRSEEAKLEAASLKAAIETAGAICHEMNQPLQVLTMGIEMLIKDQPQIQDRLDRLLSQAKRMGAITGKLLNITDYRTRLYLKETRILNVD